ncbi:MAG: sulfur carrier protein [Solirubrobacteraceae bacterium]|nr:sulfur carrier protein [Solirubrobacteraceae bacterium]
MIRLNGRDRDDVAAGETLATVLARLQLPLDARGVAIAVDGEIVPRASWPSFQVRDEARVEVLTAMQGG